MTQGDNRSISVGGNFSGIAQTGDHNTATLTMTQPPPAADVDIAKVMGELRTLMAALSTKHQTKIGNALAEAGEEAAKPAPDKHEVAGILTRALNYAKNAADFSEHIEKLKPLVIAAAGWVGAAHWGPLLAAVGLTA